MMYMLALIVVPIYAVWCFHSAYQAREKAASKLNVLLENSEIEDSLKYILVSLYDDSFKQFISAKILFWALFGNKTTIKSAHEIEVEGAGNFLQAVKALNEDNRRTYLSVCLSLFMVNVRFAPVTNILSTLIFVVSLMLRIIFGYSIKQYLNEKLNNAEKSYREHVVH